MINRVRQFRLWWNHGDKTALRLIVAIVLSLAFHLTLLLLQFGEYGEGLPGFALPLGDRRAHTPELHINLDNTPVAPNDQSVASPAVVPDSVTPPVSPKNQPEPVSVFDVVPPYRPTPPEPAPAPVVTPIVNPVVHRARVKPKVLTSAAENPDFKVAQSDQTALEPAAPEQDKPDQAKSVGDNVESINPPAAEEMTALDSRDNEQAAQIAMDKLADTLAEQQRAKQLAEKLAADKLEADKLEAERQALIAEQKKQQEAAELAAAQEQLRLKQLAQEKQQAELQAAQELEKQRQAQLAAQRAQLAEQARQEALARQQALAEQAEREKARQAQIAQQIEEQQRAEQLRKLAEAQRAEQIKQEQIKQEQIKQEQIKQEQIKQEQIKQEQIKQEQLRQAQLERDLQEKKRIEQEELKRKQEEQARQAELARQQEADRAAAQTPAQARAQTQRSDDLDDILGTRSGLSGSTGGGSAKPDRDKLLAGRSGDFDKSGDVIKSAAGTSIPMPKLESSPGARRSIFGSKNGEVDLNLYIVGWRQKIENNGRLNYSQSAKDKAFSDPLVVVSIRSDGSVENIVILRSSGRKEIDDAVRRIVIVNAPYSAFPPNLARRYDVIDIRQVWKFDELLHVTDEFR